MNQSASDLAHRLARDAEAVCRHYLSSGRREGRYWLVGDARNTPGGSLYLRLYGLESGVGAAGKWTDAATGEHGDLLDIVRLSCGLAGVGEAMAEARRFLSLPRRVPVQRRQAPRSSSEAAKRLYAMGHSARGTLAETYLRKRGVTCDLRSLPLRFHPSCYCRAGAHGPSEPRPALLAAVTNLAGIVTGVHRTWLDPANATKAQLATPRKAMGRLLGNGVRFGVGREVVAVGEGLETTLSLRSILPNLPMVAALSSAHLSALVFPPELRRLYVALDNDAAGRHALEKLRAREDLRLVEIIELVPTEEDFNEDLQRGGEDALVGTVRGQLSPQDEVRFLVGGEGRRRELACG